MRGTKRKQNLTGIRFCCCCCCFFSLFGLTVNFKFNNVQRRKEKQRPMAQLYCIRCVKQKSLHLPVWTSQWPVSRSFCLLSAEDAKKVVKASRVDTSKHPFSFDTLDLLSLNIQVYTIHCMHASDCVIRNPLGMREILFPAFAGAFECRM